MSQAFYHFKPNNHDPRLKISELSEPPPPKKGPKDFIPRAMNIDYMKL